MAFKMVAWNGEEVGGSRLGQIQQLQKRLRKNRTPSEKRFAKFMAGFKSQRLMLHFTPQKVIHVHESQAFILDFYFKRFKLAVEIDDSRLPPRKIENEWRTRIIEEHKINVMRFADHEVDEQIYDVLRKVILWCIDNGSRQKKGLLLRDLQQVRLEKPQLYGKVFPDAVFKQGP